MTDWIISSSILILTVTLLRTLLKGRISLKLQYSLWLLVLVRLLVPFSLGETGISIGNLTQRAANSEGGQLVSEIGEIKLPKMTYSAAYDQVSSEYAARGIDISQMPLEEYQRVDYAIMGKMAGGPSVNEVIRALWLGGMAVTGGCFVLSNAHFAMKLRKNRRKMDTDAPLPVFVSDSVDTPCLFGIVSPTIYVTENVTGDDTALRHVIAHETTHYRHRDNLWSVLRGVCLALHWYNPLVWAAAVLSKNDAELACDEATIKRLGEDERAGYGRTLISMTVEKRPAVFNTATTMTGSGRTIKERIALIVKKPKMAAYMLAVVALVALIAAVITFTGAKNGGEAFGEWTASLTADDIELAEVSKYFGLERRGYTVPKADYPELVGIFNGIEGRDCSSDRPQSENEDGYMLALYRDGRLWLFKALADGTVGLMFDTPETGALYGCEGSLLSIESEALWNYIVNTADTKGEPDADSMTAAQRIHLLDPSQIKNAYAVSEEIRVSKEALLPLLKSGAENPVEPPDELMAYWSIFIDFANDTERVILNAGLPENYVHIAYSDNKNSDADMASSLAAAGDSFVVQDEKLYNYIRNSFSTDDSVSNEIEQYYEIIGQYAADFMQTDGGAIDAGFTMAEVAGFSLRFETDSPMRSYDIYEVDIAFRADNPPAAVLNDDVWIDSDMRVRNYMDKVYLAVRTTGDGVEYKFLPEIIVTDDGQLDIQFVDAYFGEGVESFMINLAYSAALSHSNNISTDTAQALNAGDGMYIVEFPIPGTSTYVEVTLIHDILQWRVYDSKIIDYSLKITPELAYERISNLKAEDIVYISSNFAEPAAEDMASALAGAVKNAVDEPEGNQYMWSADVYLSGGPSGFSSKDEQINLYAGLTENIVAAWYNPEGDSDAVRLCFEDETLYWLIRNIYNIEKRTLDEAMLEPYRDILNARAQEVVDTSKNAVGADAYTGFEIVRFEHFDSFTREGLEYTVYKWDVAFTTDDPRRVGWAGGMWLDSDLRVRNVELETYFIVRSDGEYRFAFWDLFTQATENAYENIVKTFE